MLYTVSKRWTTTRSWTAEFARLWSNLKN